MWPSTQRIGKDIRANSYFFTRRAADVLPEACFTAMTEDRHNELAAMHAGPQRDRSRFDTSMISMNFNSYAGLVIFFIILFLFCFVFDHKTLLTIRVLAVFDFYYHT